MNEQRKALILDAAISVIQKTEIMAKMGAIPEYVGCSVEYITTILTNDDVRFADESKSDVRWFLRVEFNREGSVHLVSRPTAPPRWSTMPREQFIEHFNPPSWAMA